MGLPTAGTGGKLEGIVPGIREVCMGRIQAALLLAVLACFTALASDSPPFPVPAELKRDVAFWVRVYSEADSNGGFLHDDRRLDIVYDVVEFEPASSPAEQDKQIAKLTGKYQGILRALAGGKRKHLDKDERRVLALWGKRASRRALKAAAERVRFQRGQADRFRNGLVRSLEWRDHVRAVLCEMGLPKQLAVLPHVESSYHPSVYSHAGAAGLWQFTMATGLRFLRIDDVVDERLEPYQATLAAARLLKHNHDVLGTWPLSLTAYNHGTTGMVRAVKAMGTQDIAAIVRKYDGPAFGFASRNFYVSFLAALEVEQNADWYFGDLPEAPDVDTVAVPAFVSVDALERALQIDRSLLEDLNPALQPYVWQGRKRVPSGYHLRVPRQTDGPSVSYLLAQISPADLYAEQSPDEFYQVDRGDTLSEIAERAGVRTAELARLNGLASSHRIRIGQELRLPPRPAPAAVSVASAAQVDGANTDKGQQVADDAVEAMAGEVDAAVAAGTGEERAEELQDLLAYRVAADGTIQIKPEETIGHYAHWLEVPAGRLSRLNKLKKGQSLVVGKRLRLVFSRVSRQAFEERRLAYQRSLREEFFSRFQVAGTYQHQLKPGESLWLLAKRQPELPTWLLLHYNQGLDFGAIRPGTHVTIPRLEGRQRAASPIAVEASDA